MRARQPVLACAAVAAFAILWFGVGTWTAAPAAGTAALVPSVRIDFVDGSSTDLFAGAADGDGKDYVAVAFTDVDGVPRAAKATLRGFSEWHHGRVKPSLRIKQKEAKAPGASAPEFVELSRPEDPLALCNWLPDQLADRLGLLHERSEPVHLALDGRDAGVYLRSLRPGDELVAAADRARGTFWKGDSLGSRTHLDLWSNADAWRATGADNGEAKRALVELLAILREPPSAAALQRLRRVFDVEAAARAAAVAVLVGSIHADRAHNHVLFFDPTRDRLEPLSWDANGFGIHAEPTLPVEVARHPVAERLLCDPEFVHRRNQLLWDLLHGAGSAAALVAAADRHCDRLGEVLRNDPEPGRLQLVRGKFQLQPLAKGELPAARQQFTTWVQQRDAALRRHFDGAAAAISADPEHPGCARVTVFGTVAVRVARTDGAPATAIDGRDASLLLPGLSAELFAAPQHRDADGHGVPAPHARPAALSYTLAAAPAELRLANAFTNAPIAATPEPAPPLATRSVHPWQCERPVANLQLGPGEVHLDHPLFVDRGTTLTIAPGTRIACGDHASIVCRGPLLALGTATRPITIVGSGSSFAGLRCIGSPRVHLAHVHFQLLADWDAARSEPPPALALRGCPDSSLDHCRIVHAGGVALEVVAGRARLEHCALQQSRSIGLLASDGASVEVQHGRIAFARHGVVARDAARILLFATELRGHLVGCRAERSIRPFPGGQIVLEAVACAENGQCDADADDFGAVVLVGTSARPSELAAGRIRTAEAAAGTPAAPR